MLTIAELLEQARRLPPQARRALRDKLDESLAEEAQSTETTDEGPYASLLKSAGSAHSLAADVAHKKNAHLADIYATKRGNQ